MDEIQALIPSFRATLASTSLQHRNDGGGLNSVAAFARDVTGHQSRFVRKIGHLRMENAGRASVIAECDAAEQQIADLAAQAIAAANAAGKVEV
jgi:hypothetical protein